MPFNQQKFISPYINGHFVNVTKPEWTQAVRNPAKPDEVFTTLGWRKDFIGEIIDSSIASQAKFCKLELTERLSIISRFIQELLDNREELKSQMTIELGRSRFAVEEEWRLCERFFEQFPAFCQELLTEQVEREGWSWQYAPVGSVLVSTNSALPVYTLLSTALPALAAGNAVVVRPSAHCPLSASLVASCLHKASMPAGLFQIVYGDFDVFRKIVLTHHFSTVFFTGIEEMGEQLRHDLWTDPDTKLVISGAGKNAVIVFETADINDAVAKVVYGACVDCGQRIEATTLAFVHKKVLAEFTDKFVQAIKSLPISAKQDMSSKDIHFMGPLCSQKASERFLRFQGIAARESLETLRWGKPIDNEGDGYFVSPGVHLMDLKTIEKSVYATNAFFGPDVAIVGFEDASEVATILNNMNASRVLSVFSGFDEQVRSVRRLVQCPTVSWNSPTTEIEPGLPTLGRGHAGNTLETGMRFILSCVYPQVLNLKESIAKQLTLFSQNFIVLFVLLGSMFCATFAHAEYEKAVEGNDVVKGKLYPRAGRFQLLVPQLGTILNTSFVYTVLLGGGVTYHINEWHGINVGGFYGLSIDKDERKCLESFYFNPARAKDSTNAENNLPVANQDCDPEETTDPTVGDKDTDGRGPYHRKPAYMAIREIDMMFDVNYQWTPVYGKALWFLSAVGYLDLFTSIGGGVAMSTYYPLQTVSKSGKDILKQGTDILDETGKAGRPQAIQQTTPLFSLGFGARFSFFRRLYANVEFRNFTVFGSGGTDAMNFFAIWGGSGITF